MNATTTDTRRAPRRPVPEVIPVHDLMTEQTIGRLGNVSETGMLLLTGQNMPQDGLFQVNFSITDRSGARRPIDVGVHLLWKEAANAPDQWWAGFRFLTVSNEHLASLKQWIDDGLPAR